MAPLKNGNNKDNCSGDITHEQPIGKQISYRPYRRIVSFNGYFYKKDFLDWLLDLEDLFDFENIYYKRKVGLALYKISEYTLHWWKRVQSNRCNSCYRSKNIKEIKISFLFKAVCNKSSFELMHKVF